jgi:thymidylate synthase (FAD)
MDKEAIKVLDHGFVRVVDTMGDDSSIVQAARVSYGDGTKSVNDDKKLIHFLMKNRHTTPFEMCEIKLHVKLPIFVARQWVRHRTANINEYSGRYSIMDTDYYVPELENIKLQSKSNKQGREGELGELEKQIARAGFVAASEGARRIYDHLIDLGVARELCRITLPINYYTQWYWKIDLHNLLHFVKLRSDPHAQYEIREYAKVIEDIVSEWVPVTWEAYKEYIK